MTCSGLFSWQDLPGTTERARVLAAEAGVGGGMSGALGGEDAEVCFLFYFTEAVNFQPPGTLAATFQPVGW